MLRDLEMTELAPPQAGAVEREQHRAVIEILCARNEPADFLWTQDRRQAPVPLRGRQLLLQRAPLQDPNIEEAQRGHVEPDRADGELSLLE